MRSTFIEAFSFLRPKDDTLSQETKDQVQLYRMMSLLGGVLIPLFSVLYRVTSPEDVNLIWSAFGLAGLFTGLAVGSYAFRWLRRHYEFLMYGLMYVQMAWVTGIAVLNHFKGKYVLALLLIYAAIGVVIELGARSFGPVLQFLGTGFLLVAGGLFIVEAPRTDPSIVLAILGGVGLAIGVSFGGRLSIRAKLTEREQRLDERQQKITSLYRATRRLLATSSRKDVARRIREVLQKVFGYPVCCVRFADEEGLREGEQPNGEDGQGYLSGQIATEVTERAYQLNETVIEESRRTFALPCEEAEAPRGPIAAVPIGTEGVVGIGIDEGERFDLFDLQLVEMLSAYAALVVDRLRHEKQLRTAKEEAEEAARLKSAMLANMGHEIRTPLTSIIGFAEALGEEVDEESPHARFSHLIERSGHRLLQTLNGVLNLSKLEAGKMELDTEPVDLATQARRAAEEVQVQAEEANVRLRVDVNGTSAWASADTGGLQIIARNLLANAIKYTEEGGEVRVRLRERERKVALEIDDTGIGMVNDEVEQLFEPFRQASEGANRKYEGVGLGLAVTKKAVKEMDGHIDVETSKGEGSRFTVWLHRTDRPDPGERPDS